MYTENKREKKYQEIDKDVKEIADNWCKNIISKFLNFNFILNSKSTGAQICHQFN